MGGGLGRGGGPPLFALLLQGLIRGRDQLGLFSRFVLFSCFVLFVLFLFVLLCAVVDFAWVKCLVCLLLDVGVSEFMINLCIREVVCS